MIIPYNFNVTQWKKILYMYVCIYLLPKDKRVVALVQNLWESKKIKQNYIFK